MSVDADDEGGRLLDLTTIEGHAELASGRERLRRIRVYSERNIGVLDMAPNDD